MRHPTCFIVLTLAALVAPLAATAGQPAGLVAERRGRLLHLAAPQFHFLEGKPLQLLRNGASVTYVFRLTVTDERGAAKWRQVEERFVVSYDLWEEKFAVVAPGTPRRSATHLSAGALETWCLEALSPPVAWLPADKTFVVKLRCSVLDAADPPPAEGLSLSALIDAFSRKRALAPPQWEVESAPIRLSEAPRD